MAYIVSLAGSPDADARCSFLADLVGRELQRLGHGVDRLDVRELPSRALLHGDRGDPQLQQALAQVAAADALLVATPASNLAYSGVLKLFLDLLPPQGLAGKLVVPVLTAPSALPLIAASEYALKPVLSSLGVTRQLPGVLATEPELPRSASGYEPAAGLVDRLLLVVRALVEALEPARHGALRAPVSAAA